MERSRVNKRLVAAVRDLPEVTVHDLYEAYPTFGIDVGREQELLREHDAVVFQHPFYWYSTPAILKEWQDLVLQHGWAYGAGGTALRGKVTLNALTTGGPAAAYRRDGYNRFTVRELLAPWEQTAHLCQMRFLAPFVVHAALRVVGDDDVDDARDGYRRLIEGLRDERLDLERAARADNLAEELDGLFASAVVA
jgi:glutathione-regulated potassium-efflux system ancillary protein KefG